MTIIKKYKILLLSDAPMALNEGGISQTLYNLFSFIGPENLLAVAPIEELKSKIPTAPYTNRYIGYKSILFRIPQNRLTKYFSSIITWLNFSICQLKSYSKLKKSIADFNPDIIVSCPNSPIGVLMHGKLLANSKYSDRVIPYFMDDWMYKSNTKWLSSDVSSVVTAMLSQNKYWIMISNELADIFKERYNVHPEKVLCARNPVDISNALIDKLYVKGDPFTIAYAGALWPMHFDSFYAFAKAVKKLSVNHHIRLVWYTPVSYWDWRKDELLPLDVEYGGHVAYTDVHATLNKADALLITSSFSDEYYTHSKGSLQTKITDYCKSKRLILSCGPAYSANHNFIKDKQCGICIETDDSNAIADQLNLIINNISNYDNCIINGWESLKDFSKEKVHHDLDLFLQKAIPYSK